MGLGNERVQRCNCNFCRFPPTCRGQQSNYNLLLTILLQSGAQQREHDGKPNVWRLESQFFERRDVREVIYCGLPKVPAGISRHPKSLDPQKFQNGHLTKNKCYGLFRNKENCWAASLLELFRGKQDFTQIR